MIAFGCSVSEAEPYLRYAEPGIRLAAEEDSVLFPYAAVGTLGRSYNVLLDAAAAHDDLEALVIVHPHAQIDDPELCAKIRNTLGDPDVAVIGCAGATGVSSIAWWDADVSCGSVVHRYPDCGGGDLPALSWMATRPAPAEVEVVDGFLLVLSPWAVRNVRFDEGITFGHGFELDYCLRVRAAGRKVMTADLRVIQHRSLDLIGDLELWTESHIALERRWGLGGKQESDEEWKVRARRAEAEREAARAIAYSRRLAFDARVERLQRQLQEATATTSWRITAPLRRANMWRRQRLARSVGQHSA